MRVLRAGAPGLASQFLVTGPNSFQLGTRRRFHGAVTVNCIGGSKGAILRPPPRTSIFQKVERSVPPPVPPPEPLTGAVKFKLSHSCVLVIWRGNIALWFADGERDAIVAPANKRLNASYGVDGAIHRLAGPRLFNACQEAPDVGRRGIKCEVGQVVCTRGYDLQVSRVIHAVGPVYDEKSVQLSERLLAETYQNALNMATTGGIKYIAFPALSCELFGYPFNEGAEVALTTVRNNWAGLQEIHFVLKSPDAYYAWLEEARRLWRFG